MEGLPLPLSKRGLLIYQVNALSEESTVTLTVSDLETRSRCLG